jgi:hypothetical protein
VGGGNKRLLRLLLWGAGGSGGGLLPADNWGGAGGFVMVVYEAELGEKLKLAVGGGGKSGVFHCAGVPNGGATHPSASVAAVLATRGLLPAVLEAMRCADWAVRKEATWIICNAAAAGGAEHVCALVAGGVVEPLVAVLEADDARMITVVLDAMTAILAVEARFRETGNPAAAMCRFAEQFEGCGAVARLEELQEHASQEVYDKAYAILLKHYAEEEGGGGCGGGGEAEAAGAGGGAQLLIAAAAAAENPAAAGGAKLDHAVTPVRAGGGAQQAYSFAGMAFA